MGDSVAVLDYGGRWLKAGWAFNFPTEEEPRYMTPNAVLVEQEGGGSELQRPVQRGKIASWEQFESLAYYALYDLMGWELGNEGNIMLCEPLLTSRPDREMLTQLMFEVFNVNSLFVQDTAVLSLYAVGRLTGLVVDIGHDKIDVATVTEGALNPSTVRRLDYGGDQMTQLMQRQMADPSRQANGAASPMSDAAAGALTEEAAEALKELCARCAESESTYNAATGASGSPSATPAAPETFRLPDGQEFTVTTEGLNVGEALFRPGPLLGLVGPSPAEAACDSASSLDVVLRKVMMENMLLVGGGSVIPGVGARFVSEVRSMVSHSTNPNLIPTPEYMPSPAVPRDAPWVGGAVVAKVAQIQNHFIFKADYDEAGPIAVHRRCS
ncbi:hypothetical protein HYH03_016789 [Edaphochlamys debaryana]|uniref:Actin n=1 Tax=Edaphochlamys debaryana TaxID=47281 RepID=A0A835XKA3_9CHLO|nr:hypothetical protein HYH03_016789 [Edaphochlamys debaryana]|eukprot:KAG2484373.1 hypothetical protein HYH03_016789 [Edaphochlamys debaryana]